MIAFLAAATGDAGFAETIKETFGWYPAFFFAQLINFILVILVLKKFAFGPIQQMLEQRKMRIAEGEEKLKRIERQLADSEKTTAEAIAKANADAQRLIKEAQEGARVMSEQKAQEAISQAQQILERAEASAKAEREQIQSELKRKFGRLVAATTSQVAGKVLTPEDQDRINKDALAKVES